MKLPQLFLTAGLLSSGICAQIPANHLVVAENSGFGNTNGLVHVDMVAGKNAVIGGNRYAGHSTIALDPNNPGEMWGIGSGPTFSWPMYHYTLKGTSISGFGPGAGQAPLSLQFHRARRFHVHNGELLMSLRDGNNATPGLWHMDRSRKVTQLATIPDPRDIAVLGTVAYVTSGTGAGSELHYIDLAAASPKPQKLVFKLDPAAPSGAKVPSAFQCICAKGPSGIADTLMLVDTSGVIYEVKPMQTSWNVTTTNAKGLANPVAIAWHPDPKIGLVVAVGKAVYDGINYLLPSSVQKASYTSPYPITDIALESGNVQITGVGCSGSNGRTPAMGADGSPYIGNTTFQLSLASARPSALTHLVLGTTNNSIDLKILGAPKCFLHTDLLVDLVLMTNAQGRLSVPAAIPNLASLAGIRLYTQCGVADPGANNAGLVTSNALGISIR